MPYHCHFIPTLHSRNAISLPFLATLLLRSSISNQSYTNVNKTQKHADDTFFSHAHVHTQSLMIAMWMMTNYQMRKEKHKKTQLLSRVRTSVALFSLFNFCFLFFFFFQWHINLGCLFNARFILAEEQ